MPRSIEFYFSMVSPWAYVGDKVFNEIVARHGVAVSYKPVRLPALFSETGGLPLPQRHPARQAHRWYELQRWRAQRDIELNLQPKFWPFDFALADKLVIAVIVAGHDPADLISRGLRAIWVEEADLADQDTLERLAGEAGFEASALLASAASEETEQHYQQNLRDAVGAGVFGSPSVVMDGEVFWGQDRYEQLDAALGEGRDAYRVPG
ncbi:MAG: 2-hydroxychromene-2-carboxylate isomerase [Rhizobiales bacterium]|nr:2-hydroxychromene-2-carboxylate isomerase [Hyphomicrobiales bacterium]